MSISRFNLDTPASDMQSLYGFLNANKAGTFLEDVTIGLSENDTKLTISTTDATFEISAGSIVGTDNLATFTANVTSSIVVRSGSSGQSSIKLKGAILCNKGLIFDISCDFGHSPEIALTIDNTGDLAVIFKNSSSFLSGGSSTAIISISGYCITATSSISEATVTLTPQYGAQKTSLAPIVPMCNDNSISLPYIYAALHTQTSDVGIQSMTMDGNNYITNGVWYIKD